MIKRTVKRRIGSGRRKESKHHKVPLSKSTDEDGGETYLISLRPPPETHGGSALGKIRRIGRLKTVYRKLP